MVSLPTGRVSGWLWLDDISLLLVSAMQFCNTWPINFRMENSCIQQNHKPEPWSTTDWRLTCLLIIMQSEHMWLVFVQ